MRNVYELDGWHGWHGLLYILQLLRGYISDVGSNPNRVVWWERRAALTVLGITRWYKTFLAYNVRIWGKNRTIIDPIHFRTPTLVLFSTQPVSDLWLQISPQDPGIQCTLHQDTPDTSHVHRKSHLPSPSP